MERNRQGMQQARERLEMHTVLWLEKLKSKDFLEESEVNRSIYW
jgi:hypothetical protein